MDKKPAKTICYTAKTPNCGIPQFCVSSDDPPPFFYADENVTPELLSRVLSNRNMTETQKELISNIYELCSFEQNNIINSDKLSKSLVKKTNINILGITRSALLKRIKPLVEMGVLVELQTKKEKPAQGKNPHLYVLKNPSSKEDLLAPSTAILIHKKQTGLALESSLKTYKAPKIDDFWCQLIAAALPIYDQSKTKQLTAKVPFKGGEIPLRMTSLANSRIPTIRSITTIIALLTVVEQIIKQNEKTGTPIKQRYCVEMAQLIKVKGQKNLGSNRTTALQHLREWNDTQFTFDDLPPDVLNSISKTYGSADYGFSTHQLISQLCAVGELKSQQKIPSFIEFELPLDLVKRITTVGVYNLFTVTPSIMKEDTPLAIAFHLYCRKKLGHNTHLLTPKLITLWKEIASSMTYKNFVKAFKVLLVGRKIEISYLPEDQKHIQQAKILGYLVTLNKDLVVINVDGEDRYVGTMSTHKRLLAKEEREQSSQLKKTKKGRVSDIPFQITIEKAKIDE